MRTWLTEQFDLSLPVISAPMAGVSGGRLAASVSAGGALGMIGVSPAASTGWLRSQLELAAESGRPYGVGMLGWALELSDAHMHQVIQARPDLVSVSFGEVERWVAPLHDSGIALTAQAGNLLEAFALEDMGVDFLVVRGGEGGGHGRNEVATLPLLQAVLDEVDVPVLAAGGIATGRGLAAVLAAGAAGAWVGTAFTCCPEADTSIEAQEAIVRAQLGDTVYGSIFDIAQQVPWPAQYGGRALRNRFTEIWLHRESELAAGTPAAVAASDQVRAAQQADDIRYAPVYVGQAAGLVESERPVADVLAEFASAAHHLHAVTAILATDDSDSDSDEPERH
ncbi:MAG: nitronate monooxygenase [Nakamurella sp.]